MTFVPWVIFLADYFQNLEPYSFSIELLPKNASNFDETLIVTIKKERGEGVEAVIS
jgi:hypothetical protein